MTGYKKYLVTFGVITSKSSEASKSTAALIEGTVQAVEKGTEIATVTAESLGAFVESAKEAVSTVWTRLLPLPNRRLTPSRKEELSSQAQILKNLVSQFKLLHAEETGSPIQPPPIPLAEAAVLLQGSGKY